MTIVVRDFGHFIKILWEGKSSLPCTHILPLLEPKKLALLLSVKDDNSYCSLHLAHAEQLNINKNQLITLLIHGHPDELNIYR